MITLTTEQAQQIEEALDDIVRVFEFETGTPVEALATIRAARAQGQAEPKCNPHPDAPHGFDRNASHSANRYVCECEGWEPEQAEQEPFDMDDHPPHRLCECRKCMEYFTPLPDCDAFAASGKPIAEPVKQEPVGYAAQSVIDWLVSDERTDAAYSGINLYKNPTGNSTIPLYAAPVSAEAAVLAEREACAKVCEEFGTLGDSESRSHAEAFAAAIRSRNEK